MGLLAQDLTFFFGAGASAAFGIPTMKKMTADFENEIKANGSDSERELYYEIIGHLKEDLKSRWMLKQYSQ
jgi:NAD-dependent SIR2 family protein deacetylase